MKSQPRILVIDDEPDNFDVIEALLHTEGYQLSYVSDGVQAFELLDKYQPDLILLDVMMPRMTGVEFCQQFKARAAWQPIPVMMVTALTTTEDLARCLTAGADDFISKPVKGGELRARVRSLLRIKRQYDDLQGLLKLREDMVNMVVHDLRNPLATILLGTEMLQTFDYSPEKQALKFQQIATAGKELQGLIDDLLLMARLEAGKLMLNRVQVDLSTLGQEVLEGFEAIATQKNLTLCSQLPGSGHSVQVDAALFRRLLDNLLSNAIKFSPKEGKIMLAVRYLEEGGAEIQVADQGRGVREDLRQQIFEKFEIGAPLQNIQQVGLGLAFCKIAAEAHGGTITVEDNVPQGAIFRVVIPEH